MKENAKYISLYFNEKEKHSSNELYTYYRNAYYLLQQFPMRFHLYVISCFYLLRLQSLSMHFGVSSFRDKFLLEYTCVSGKELSDSITKLSLNPLI